MIISKNKKHRGFTLIELLIVVAIIGILASVVLIGLGKARAKARNAVRITNMKNYTDVFELAYDENGEYPDPNTRGWRCLGDFSDDRCWGSGTSVPESSVLNDVLDDWIALPADESLICGYPNRSDLCYEGPIYRCVTRTDGICSSIDVRWFLEGGGEDCGVGTRIGNYRECVYCRYQASF